MNVQPGGYNRVVYGTGGWVGSMGGWWVATGVQL